MKVSVDDVKYIAKLAKLKFSDKELEKMTKEFESILSHFEAIDNANLDEIRLDEFDKVNTEFRKDRVEVFEDKKKLFSNVKSMRGTSIEVPKVIE
ncbi:Asp-tRNA(Asn)/Glu-tRNA(Gln) amidotransferase subunit GatC [Clostridium bovifaecis]|uniref:Aspartyl/glutamyl-tRNA(Asn/Gln) amidotransferase subunit C n=1 Tax=Clostridium bovifaecis TaxID=2184719 RepID=A0A6I6F9W2_9CLOT|nr:Asp-tRNA(Asn)/Glu-tRNA(Gln) amidotransferase subunit GatC [Clostridium bovifaecis]